MVAIVAVVGVLAMLTVGVLKGAVAKAQSVKCVNNLRQLGGAAIQYATEHSGDLPPAYMPTSGTDSKVFYRLLNPYLAALSEDEPDLSKYPKVYRCPADAAPFLGGVASYAANQSLATGSGARTSSGNIFNPEIPRSQVILFIDASRASLRPGWGGAYEKPAFRHSGVCNAVMMDGSAIQTFKESSSDLAKSWGL